MNKKSTITDLPNDIRIAVPHHERSPYVQEIIKQAQHGEFHDYKNRRYSCGKTQLAFMLRQTNKPELLPIRQAVIDGEYDEEPDKEDIAAMKKDWIDDGGSENLFNSLFGEK